MSDAIEIEARFINLDQSVIEEKLRTLGARKEAESLFREWIFSYEEWETERKRLRVRDDGEKVWLTYKANPTWELDSTQEIEITTSSALDTVEILKKIGIPFNRYQEKKRIQYRIADVHVDLDFWPEIPMVLEIEATSKEKVRDTAHLLGLPWEDAIFFDHKKLHKEYYGIDLDTKKEYVFI